MKDSSDKLIKSEIKCRSVIYYLTTEEDLQNVKSNSLLGNLFFGLLSLVAGGTISVILTRATGIQLEQQTTDVLDILLKVFITFAVIFACLCAYFLYQSFAIIKKIKSSGIVKSLKSENQQVIVETPIGNEGTLLRKSPLEILKAEYGTSNKKLDVTKELRQRIDCNKLDLIASNEIKGDPDFGKVKKLTIEYKFDGIFVTKQFSENERVVIPGGN